MRWSGLLTLALQSPPGIHRIFMMAAMTAMVRYAYRERERERESGRSRGKKRYTPLEKDKQIEFLP